MDQARELIARIRHDLREIDEVHRVALLHQGYEKMFWDAMKGLAGV